jgi:hypothetical protein
MEMVMMTMVVTKLRGTRMKRGGRLGEPLCTM